MDKASAFQVSEGRLAPYKRHAKWLCNLLQAVVFVAAEQSRTMAMQLHLQEGSAPREDNEDNQLGTCSENHAGLVPR